MDVPGRVRIELEDVGHIILGWPRVVTADTSYYICPWADVGESVFPAETLRSWNSLGGIPTWHGRRSLLRETSRLEELRGCVKRG